MPELKNRSLEEIDELFVHNVPAWKFKTYRTTIQDEALAEVRRQEDEDEEDEKKQSPRSEHVSQAKGGGST